MNHQTRDLVFGMSIEEVSRELDLSARGVVALVEHGLVAARLPQMVGRAPALSDAQFRSDQVRKMAEAEGELVTLRAMHPVRTRDYDRAMALGALLRILGR